jgi:AraC-like DNA-binding protein
MQGTCYENRRANTRRRHEAIRRRVDEMCAMRFEGIRLNYDDVVAKVANEFGYSPSMVCRILKKI